MQIHAYRRKEPTPVELFQKTYLFAPNAAGHCVAEVEDSRAVVRLLAIPEAYREYDAATAPAVSSAPAPLAATIAPAPTAPTATIDTEDDGPEPLKGSDTLPPVIDLGHGKTITIEELVALAQSRADLDAEEWNLNDDEDRESLLQAQVDTLRETIAREAAAAEASSAPAAAPTAEGGEGGTDTPTAGMVVTNGEQSIDIGVMTAAQVRAFAAEAGVELPKGNSVKVADLRTMLYQALTKSAT
ncbi:hypothetical protein [Pseudacidovorax intermedius]|uniref:hypothetical protein n=1 Tax=Pseudacidovorax intermedius TaxID=433924 RepID=UPI00034CAD98|nr:hypothetical protein [Pseudacidovorax intermedius]